MTKWGYVFCLIFIAFSLVSMFLFDRGGLAGELALYIFLTLLLLRKLWKCEHSEGDAHASSSQKHDYAEISLEEQKLWLRKRQRIMDDENRVLKQSAVYKRFAAFLRNPSKTLLTDADWEELARILEDVIPNFQSVRLETEQMPEDDYRLCVLIRYGFKPSEIATIMGKTTSYITKKRLMILHEIFHVPGSASELDIRLLDIF